MHHRILVTGASGFVGRSLVYLLAKDPDCFIIANGRRSVSFFEDLDNVLYIAQDFADPFEDREFDYCFHCAAKVDDMGSYEDFFQENVMKTESLINNLGNKVHFIYISTSSVYDFTPQNLMVESQAALTNGLSHYGATKLLAEQLVISMVESYVIIRPRAVYGALDTTLLPRVMKLRKANFVLLPNRISVMTSLTNIDLLCGVAVKCLDTTFLRNTIVNVCDDNTYSMHEVIVKSVSKKNDYLIPIKLPISFLKYIASSEYFNKRVELTEQTIAPFRYNSVLNNSLLRRFYTQQHPSFDEYMDEINLLPKP